MWCDTNVLQYARRPDTEEKNYRKNMKINGI